MAETEDRAKQDIGADEAYIVNLKKVVEDAHDVSGRNRIYFDALAQTIVLGAQNATVSSNAINQLIVAAVKQGLTTTGKQDEQITGVNMTDIMEKAIANSPFEELAKAIATAVVGKMNATA
ncbi:MAG: hypothetical protein ACFFFO_17700 [Candidatus Thorarchaeota archaeon]